MERGTRDGRRDSLAPTIRVLVFVGGEVRASPSPVGRGPSVVGWKAPVVRGQCRFVVVRVRLCRRRLVRVRNTRVNTYTADVRCPRNLFN